MDLVTGGTLRSRLDQLPLDDGFRVSLTRFFTACVIEALVHLHERRIMYRDLKPENVLIDGAGYGTICDLGLAKFSPGRPSFTVCGTRAYMAPEIMSKRGYNAAVDWWALGVTMVQMLTG